MEPVQTVKSPRGFALLTPERRAEIGKMGADAAGKLGKRHKWTHEEAIAAGRKGGLVVSQDKRHMAEIGRKGGESISKDNEKYMQELGRRGGKKVAEDREHMRQIGKLGAAAKSNSNQLELPTE